jgi:hypothetical protein
MKYKINKFERRGCIQSIFINIKELRNSKGIDMQILKAIISRKGYVCAGFMALIWVVSAQAGIDAVRKGIEDFHQDADRGRLITTLKQETPGLLAEVLRTASVSQHQDLCAHNFQGEVDAERIQINLKPLSPSVASSKTDSQDQPLAITLRVGYGSYQYTCDFEVKGLSFRLEIPIIIRQTLAPKGYTFLGTFLSGATHRIYEGKLQ